MSLNDVDDDLPPLGEGEILAGKYRVERVLGVGGVGVVVAAVHMTLGQRVALKFLRKSAARDSGSIERFLREARAVVRLKSQHTIRVQDVGTLESGEPYMVMELLEGCDFATLLEERGSLSLVEAVTYVLQACESLAEAHASGVVHRDLKPENLFLTTGVDHLPLVKVLDFGLVKEIQPSAPATSGKSLTGGIAMGTPGYMSPEQIKSTRDVDARADIWSMGVVLYELLSGSMPFSGDSIPELIAAIVRDRPRPLTEVTPAIPARLSDVVAKCLEKNPADRFQKISKLAAALDEFVAPSMGGAGARLGLVQPSTAPPPTPAIAWRPTGVVAAQKFRESDAKTLDEIPPTGGRERAEHVAEKRRSYLPLVLMAVVATGGIVFGVHHLTSRSAATPEVSSATPIATVAPSVELSSVATQPSVPPQVPPVESRSPVMSSSSAKTASRAPASPKGAHGGKDAGADESKLLDTR